MNPTRRGLLGLIPAGLFGGKRLAQEVLETAAAQSGLSGTRMDLASIVYPANEPTEGSNAPLKLLKIASTEWQTRHWREISVNCLDTDILANGSWSLSHKVLRQKERNFRASISSKKSFWERVMMGDNMESEWL